MIAAPSPICLTEAPGDNLALRFERESLTYHDLSVVVGRAAAALRRDRIGQGATFALLAENCPEVMIAYYAAAVVGAIFIPINPSLKSSEVSYVVEHSGARLLYHDDAMKDVAQGSVPASQLRPIQSLLAEQEGPVVSSRDRAGSDHDDFLIVYTSGSTGRPKAVVFDWAAEVAGNAALIEMWRINPEDRMVVALPLGFLYGLSTAAATGFQAGCEVILLRRFSPARVIDAFVENRATIFHGVPTMFAMMLNYAEENDLTFDLSFMRLLICAGAPLNQTLRARWVARFGKTIDDYYALTEVRPIFGRFHDDGPVPAGALGKAAPGADVRIVDANGADVPVGQQGELLVRGASTLVRYHKDAALTASVMNGRHFATGDLGYCDAAGYYRLTGRIKDLIIRGGANIAPAEVEGVLATHPAVSSVAVVGKADPTFGELPIAFVLLRQAATAADLIAHCKTLLADFKVPVRIEMLPEFPLGITGKVDKIALRQLAKDLP